jgi:aryl-alcohol dehydrogenase-like predicted oxidoreductase
MVEAQWISQVHNLNAFVSCQDEFSLVARGVERDLVPALEAYRLGLLPYLPLAGGFLTGKYNRGVPLPEGARLTVDRGYHDRYMTDANWRTIESLREFAEKRSHTLLELAFSWLEARSYVASIIAGATRPDQVEKNVTAVGWKLSADDLHELDAVTGHSCGDRKEIGGITPPGVLIPK